MVKMGQTSWSTRSENEMQALAALKEITFSFRNLDGYLHIGYDGKPGTQHKGYYMAVPEPVTTIMREDICYRFSKHLREEFLISEQDVMRALGTFYGVEILNELSFGTEASIPGFFFLIEGYGMASETYGMAINPDATPEQIENTARSMQLTILLNVHGKTVDEWMTNETARALQLGEDLKANEAARAV